MAHLFDGKKGKQDFETLITPKLEALKTTFQSNVNSMYDALVGKGKTPTAKTPAAISTAITNIFDDVYTKFVNQGTTPSAKTVSGMSSAVDSLATAKYNSGVAATKKGNAGQGDVLSGKTFTNASAVNTSGTMKNNGAWTSTPTGSGKTTIPAGYHNGSGYVDTSTVYNNGKNAGYPASASYKNITPITDLNNITLTNLTVGRIYIISILAVGDGSSSVPNVTGANLLTNFTDTQNAPNAPDGTKVNAKSSQLVIKATATTVQIKHTKYTSIDKSRCSVKIIEIIKP